MTALLTSPEFNLSNKYYTVTVFAGIKSAISALGLAALARFAEGIRLQSEADFRQAPRTGAPVTCNTG